MPPLRRGVDFSIGAGLSVLWYSLALNAIYIYVRERHATYLPDSSMEKDPAQVASGPE